MRLALCFCMSTPIQILVLCLAFVGSLIFAVALARVLLEVIFAVMDRGLPRPQHSQGKGKLISADLQLCGTRARPPSDRRAVVRYRYTLRILEDRAGFRARRRSERRVAPLTNRQALSELGSGHPGASPAPSILQTQRITCFRRRYYQQHRERVYRSPDPFFCGARRAGRRAEAYSTPGEDSRRMLYSLARLMPRTRAVCTLFPPIC